MALIANDCSCCLVQPHHFAATVSETKISVQRASGWRYCDCYNRLMISGEKYFQNGSSGVPRLGNNSDYAI